MENETAASQRSITEIMTASDIQSYVIENK